MCPQFSRATQTVVGEEDCLFLNVFVPERAIKNNYVLEEDRVLLPVVVFIHGGAYQVIINIFTYSLRNSRHLPQIFSSLGQGVIMGEDIS